MLDTLRLSGLLTATIYTPDPDAVRFAGCTVERAGQLLVARRRNIFVNTGLNLALDRLFGLGGTAVSHIGVSADNQAVGAGTTKLDPAGDATGISIKPISPAASRAGQTVTAGATFTEADVAFSIRKVGLLNTATDAGTGLVDVIGGTGNEPFTIDLTGTTSFTLTMQIQVTASAA